MIVIFTIFLQDFFGLGINTKLIFGLSDDTFDFISVVAESKYARPEEPAAKGSVPPAKPCVLGGNTGKRCTNFGEEVFPGGQPKKPTPTPTIPPLTGAASKIFSLQTTTHLYYLIY